MKTSSLKTGSIYSYVKDTYSKGKAVLVLDTKMWTAGRAFGQTEFVISPAAPGSRPNVGTYRNNYRSVGVPVLKLDQDLFHWREGVADDCRVMDSHEDILARAVEILGTDKLGDGPMSRESAWIKIPVTMGDGKRSTVTVTLCTVRPQTITSGWTNYVEQELKVEEAQKAAEARRQAEKERQGEVSNDVALRLDALLGDKTRTWNGRDRTDCKRVDSGSAFEVSEETLLKLLALAEQGQQS